MIDRNYRYLGSCVLLAAAMAAASPALSADMHDRVGGSMKDMGELEHHMGGLWTGFYLGGHAGWGRGSFNPTELDPVFAGLIDEEVDHEPSGGVFGVQAGYNWQRSRWVLGVEGDIAASNAEGEMAYDFNFTSVDVDAINGSQSSDLKYIATLRARLGVDVGPLMLYATGGLALGRVDSNFSVTIDGGGILPDGTVEGSDSVTHVGYAVGGGVEAWLRQDISIKGEYLYTDLGEEVHQPIDGVDGNAFDLDFHLIRFGLNYHF